MRPLGRDSFARDLLVLLLVGIILASFFSTAIAAGTDSYFTKAVTGVIGDYGQYDLIFQTRAELREATARQLERVVGERFPGSRVRPGLSVAGKSTIFFSFAARYRTREVFESLDYYFGNLPGNAGFSIITEPRLVLSAVPGGAQELLRREFSRLPDVVFVFRDGDSLNLVLRSARGMDELRRQVKRILGRYQLLEIRFPIDNPVSDVGALGRQLEGAVRRVPGVSFCQDVTRGDGASDMQYMAAALSEMRRFMVSYAARVCVRPAGTKDPLLPGDRLVLQGRASRPPVPGRAKDERFVVVKLDRVQQGVGEGLIVQGDASYVKNPAVFRLLPGEKVGEYIGAATVVDERSALGRALDESVKLLRQVEAVAADSAWDAAGSLRNYQGVLDRIAGVQKLLTATRDGLGVVASAETSARLHLIAAQIDGVSADLDLLAETTARLRLAENRVDAILDQVRAFQLILQATVLRNGPDQIPTGLGQRLLAADQGITALGESLRRKARQADDLLNRLNPLVQVLLGWSERAHVLAEQLEYFRGVLTPDSKARQAFDRLFTATDATLERLRGFDALGVLRGMTEARGRLSSVDLGSIIAQMQFIRDSLPRLLDEEIGRSVGMIDRYLGGEVIPGGRIQILTNAGADVTAVSATMRRVTGRGAANVLRLPAGAIEPDFRGEIFRVLGEVRTTIIALVLLALFILEFLLDQTAVVAMLRRQAEAVSRRVVGTRTRLARPAAFVLNPARVYAAVFGALWLWACFALTGAHLPLLGHWGAAPLGGALGLLFGSLSERINPIDGDEVLAGESLGLPFVLIMREIVIPAGRPGLLQTLNRRRLRMGGKGAR